MNESNYSAVVVPETDPVAEIVEKLKAVTLKRHNTPEELLGQQWGIPASEVVECAFGGGHILDVLDENYDAENEVKGADLIEQIKESGFHGFADVRSNTLHFWLDRYSTERADLVHFFAHELTHLTRHADSEDTAQAELQCEIEAESYGRTAKRAFELMQRLMA